MAFLTSLKSQFDYARELLEAGLDACDSVQHRTEGRAFPTLSRLACDAWLPGIIGASVGALTIFLKPKNRSANNAVLYGMAGGVIGFSAAIIWGSRQWTGAVAREAAERVNVVRDSRWLEKHPINYA